MTSAYWSSGFVFRGPGSLGLWSNGSVSPVSNGLVSSVFGSPGLVSRGSDSPVPALIVSDSPVSVAISISFFDHLCVIYMFSRRRFLLHTLTDIRETLFLTSFSTQLLFRH